MTKGQIVTVVNHVNNQLKVGTKWVVAREMVNGAYQIVKLGKQDKPLSWVFNPENVAYTLPSDIQSLVNEGFVTVG